jgi:tRNA pseudouridine55 synthase
MSTPSSAGVLVIDKPPGLTSFDVVDRIRRRLGIRRVGHAGTLDPDAMGVLPVLLGEATKLMPYLIEHEKEYRAIVRFGVRTDTQDLSGRILSETAVPEVTAERVASAARAFVGRISQTPPMFSALRHRGRRLYELAREGVDVERAPREVVVHAIELEALSGARATLRIVCGKGTYVRTLAADLGDALGIGAAVEALTRLRVGPFRLADAVSWSDVVEATAHALRTRVRSPATALSGWPEVRLDAASADAFRHGQSVSSIGATPGCVRVHELDGTLIGVGAVDSASHLRPIRILHADRPNARRLPA